MRHVPRTAAALAVAALASLAPAAPAAGSIVVGEHIAGVRLGAPLTDVVARWGEPSRRLVGEEEADYGLLWDRKRLHALMRASDDTVLLVSTTSTRQRTRRNVGPGVTERTARRRLTGERCSRFTDADRDRSVLGCAVRTTGAVTTFVIWLGRVREVTLEPRG